MSGFGFETALCVILFKRIIKSVGNYNQLFSTFVLQTMWIFIEELSRDLEVRILKNPTVHTSTFSGIGFPFLLSEYRIPFVIFSVFIGYNLHGQLLGDYRRDKYSRFTMNDSGLTILV